MEQTASIAVQHTYSDSSILKRLVQLGSMLAPFDCTLDVRVLGAAFQAVVMKVGPCALMDESFLQIIGAAVVPRNMMLRAACHRCNHVHS